ncbi:MAG: isoprenyl transferase [Armatimonadetes bacterium]|nr:isoprenyl transferase [Armatimonadota bacterium]MDW8028808.1 isoprenyl transferase [Armatimonadota bacterium]
MLDRKDWENLSEEELRAKLDMERLPKHVAIIMDGNRRWAKQKGLPVLQGHRAGSRATRQVIEACVEIGIPILTLYAFSTENWKRPPLEVQTLFRLMEVTLKRERDELNANGVRVRHIGVVEGLPESLVKTLQETEEMTGKNKTLLVNVAINYGGRNELVRAVRSIAKKVALGQFSPDDIDEEVIKAHLDTDGLPDPDLLIRTGNEWRVSNFLLWQIAYTEIYVTPTLWPDFNKREFLMALLNYQSRERRFGGVSHVTAR